MPESRRHNAGGIIPNRHQMTSELAVKRRLDALGLHAIQVLAGQSRRRRLGIFLLHAR